MGSRSTKVMVDVKHSPDMLTLILQTLPFMEGGWTCDYDSVEANMNCTWASVWGDSIPKQFTFDLETHTFSWNNKDYIDDPFCPTNMADLSLLLEKISEMSAHFDGRNTNAFPCKEISIESAVVNKIAQDMEHYYKQMKMSDLFGYSDSSCNVANPYEDDLSAKHYEEYMCKVYSSPITTSEIYQIHNKVLGFHGPRANKLRKLIEGILTKLATYEEEFAASGKVLPHSASSKFIDPYNVSMMISLKPTPKLFFYPGAKDVELPKTESSYENYKNLLMTAVGVSQAYSTNKENL